MKLMIILILVIILIAGCTQQPTTSKQTQSEIDIGPGRTGEFTFEYKDPIGDVKPYMELPEGYHNFGDITKHIDIKRFSVFEEGDYVIFEIEVVSTIKDRKMNDFEMLKPYSWRDSSTIEYSVSIVQKGKFSGIAGWFIKYENGTARGFGKELKFEGSGTSTLRVYVLKTDIEDYLNKYESELIDFIGIGRIFGCCADTVNEKEYSKY